MTAVAPYHGESIAACEDLPPDYAFPEHKQWIDNIEELPFQEKLSQRKVNLIVDYVLTSKAKNRNAAIKAALKKFVLEGEFTSDDLGVVYSVFTVGVTKEQAQDERAREMIAKACSFCPQAQFDSCLSYALHNKVEGIWAGTTEKDRVEIRIEQGIKAKKVSASIKRTQKGKRSVYA